MKKFLEQKGNGIMLITYYQDKFFKHFKEKEKFIKMLGKLKIHRSTLTFKIIVFKLIEKYLKLLKSSVTLTFLKNYFKDIKKI